jgi:hypothetical protein
MIATQFIGLDKVVRIYAKTFHYLEIGHAAAKKAFAGGGKELILRSLTHTYFNLQSALWEK